MREASAIKHLEVILIYVVAQSYCQSFYIGPQIDNRVLSKKLRKENSTF